MGQAEGPVSARQQEWEALNRASTHRSAFDFASCEAFRNRGKSSSGPPGEGELFKFLGNIEGCASCHQGFQLDSYQNGCTHDCLYCFSKNVLEKQGRWNNPVPLPLDLLAFRKRFYGAFERDSSDPISRVLRRRIPLRLGHFSDPFIPLERKVGVTAEILKILKAYRYPHVIVTRSDLVAAEENLVLYDRELTAIQFSIPSMNEALTRVLEPQAPSPARRLEALEKLVKAGIWTVTRVNPFFPPHPDGFFSKGGAGASERFDFFTPALLEAIASTGCRAVLVGMASVDGEVLAALSKASGKDLSRFFQLSPGGRAFYSEVEKEHYFKELRALCHGLGMHFSTCYLGQDEGDYSRFLPLSDNPGDCCIIKSRVAGHRSDSKDINKLELLLLGEGRGDGGGAKWKRRILEWFASQFV